MHRPSTEDHCLIYPPKFKIPRKTARDMSKQEKKRHHIDSDEEDRKAHKKSHKKAAKVAKLLGYTNEINPFGDGNLLQPFLWGKKLDKDKREGKLTLNKVEDKRLNLLDEISRVRKRREDRAKELEEMERLRNEEQRLREAATYGNWQQKEEDFHIDQTRVRSIIRIAERREQPIDTLAKNILLLSVSTAELEQTKSHRGVTNGSSSSSRVNIPNSTPVSLKNVDAELRNPVDLIENLNDKQIEALIPDIESYLQLSIKNFDSYTNFWRAVKTIATSVSRANRLKSSGAAIHRSIFTEVEKLICGKTSSELDLLQRDIKNNLHDGKAADRAYWEEVSEQVEWERARVLALQEHRTILLQVLDLLKDMKVYELEQRQDIPVSMEGGTGPWTRDYSSEELTPREDGVTAEDAVTSQELLNDEEKMGQTDEIALPGKTYLWQDKHRPRKPRYFNRVRTGWDWNKYNQTHYDHDNPPPKSIHGYKFAIFYPDLIDKTTTPRYYLEGTDSPDFAIIRFHAGPPYEDIAFKIVNKEWDTDRRAGFRCVFERGMLQLHFNFKRRWYRR